MREQWSFLLAGGEKPLGPCTPLRLGCRCLKIAHALHGTSRTHGQEIIVPFGHTTQPDAENPDDVGKEKTRSNMFWS